MAKNWAIAIGINEYEFLQPLRYAKRDAEIMHHFFLEAEFDRILFFTDDSPDVGGKSTHPSRANLRRVLRQVFEQPFMADGDNFWFFFSGHGIRYQDRDYLMPIDGDPEDVLNTGIPTTYVTERLRRCGADNVVMILDACRSEGRKGGVGIGPETEDKARQTGIISLFSCSPEQYSYEIEAIQQGAFTTALIEGLGIQGRCATVERLNQYLKRRVPEIVSQHLGRAKQVPYVIAEPIERSHLILRPIFASLADVALLKNDAARAERRQQWDIAQSLWIRVLAAAAGQDMDAIEALQHIAIRRTIASPTLETAIASISSPVFAKSAAIGPPPLADSAPTTPFSSRPPEQNPNLATPSSPPSQPWLALKPASTHEPASFTPALEKMEASFTEDLDNGICLEMLKIPGGSFILGSLHGENYSAKRPQQMITVPSFYLGKYLVNQALYTAVMGSNPSHFKNNHRPVERVSWNDAIAFCQRLSQLTGKSYRLPNHTEWEYACRAGRQTKNSFGNTTTPELANYMGNLDPTGDANNYPPNAFDLCDMQGNMWEWCIDPWPDNGTFDEKSPLNQSELGTSHPCSCRSIFRFYGTPDLQHFGLSFRVALTLSATSSLITPLPTTTSTAVSSNRQPAVLKSQLESDSNASNHKNNSHTNNSDDGEEIITEIIPPPPKGIRTHPTSQRSQLKPPTPYTQLSSAISSPVSPPPKSIVTTIFSFATVQVDDKGDVVQRHVREAKYFTQELDHGICFDMVRIPAGSFMMGSPDGEGRGYERPQHRVSLPRFYMGKYVVTQALYTAVMGDNPSNFIGPQRPVEKISWHDAIAFCTQLSQLTGRHYRLPSEAEWEYACRAGNPTKYSFGNTLAPGLANYNKQINQTTNVGSYPANNFGLFDMHGNVWEWCADPWHKNYHGAPTDGKVWAMDGSSDRVIRGGSWSLNSRFCSSTYRNRVNSSFHDLTFGFRVVLSLR